MKNTILYFLALLAIVTSACDTGSPLANKAPETRIFLDKIELSGTDRLNSVVDLHWTGEDVDGFVKGYAISFDGINWSNTTVTDSTFRFSITSGSDTADVTFYVKAWDNKGLYDATPAFLKIPIRNAAPAVLFDVTNPVSDTVYSVFSTLWTYSDLDGEDTIDSVYLKLNDGAWSVFPKSMNFATFIPSAPKTAGLQNALVRRGEGAIPTNVQIAGLNVEGVNRLYVKVKDKAGAFSAVDSTDAFFVRRQTANVLVIDEAVATTNPTPESVYYPILQNLGIAYDAFNLSQNVPAYWDPTFAVFLTLYDKVFWFSEGAEYTVYGNKMYLEVASLGIQNYLNKGGKMLITTKFPARFNAKATAYTSPIFSYSPIDSLSTSVGQARIPVDSSAFGMNAFGGYPTLKPVAFLSGVDPFYAKNPNRNLYYSQLQKAQGWQGPNTICGSSVYTNNRINQVFFSVELHKLSGDLPALQTVIGKILNEEFNW